MPETRKIYQHLSLLGVWYRFADAIGIIIGLLLSLPYGVNLSTDRLTSIAAVAIVVYFLVAEGVGLYRSWRGVTAHRELANALVGWGFTLAILLLIGAAAGHVASFSRISMFTWFITAPALIVIGRMGTRIVLWGLRSLGYNARTYAIVGVNELAFQLARNVDASPELGLRLAGFFDDRPDVRNPPIPKEIGQRLGTLQDLVEQAGAGRIDRVYITFPLRAEDRIRDVLDRLSDTPTAVYLVPDIFVFQLLHSRWSDILGLPVVSVFESPLYGVDGLAKRLFDLVLGTIFLLLAALPMLLIAAAIKLTSAGPVFFRQRRYGLDGREIRVWKFRTMTVCEDGPEIVQARRNDPRVTPLGAVLRRMSLDELPQLFNVLAGSMSLVGPRPHAQSQNEVFRSQIVGYMLRHKIKPGITGLAQVNGWRGETDTPEKIQKRLEYDLRYIREWSLWLDFAILLKTPWVVLSRKNAY